MLKLVFCDNFYNLVVYLYLNLHKIFLHIKIRPIIISQDFIHNL